MPRKPLYLHEEVMLLALKDEKGTIAAGTMYQMATGGAILAELLLRERVQTETHRRKIFAVVKEQAPFGELVLDECLSMVTAAKRRADLKSWVTRFARLKQLKHRVAEGLADRGILKADEDTVLLLFTRRIYPERDHRPEQRIIERLERSIRAESGTVDPRTTILVALAHHGGLLKQVFEKRLLKARKKRIEAICKGDAIGQATKDAIQAVQAAIAVAAVMPAVVATTSSH